MYKILLADDEGIVLDSLKFIINKNFGASCQMQTAKTGRQAIETAQDFVPDIIFMDIQMPGIKGIDAIREIRRFNKTCQFIIMSAYDKFTFAQEAIDLGVIEYLTKPAPSGKIISAIEKAMANIDRNRSRQSQDLMIREKLESVVPLIENGFLNLLLFQENSAPANLEKYLELLGVSAACGWIMVLEFCGDPDDDASENPVGSAVRLQKYRLAFREIIHEFFPEAIIGSVMANSAALFFPHESASMEYEERIRIIETARNMVRKLKKQIALKFRAGIGNVWPVAEQRSSYDEARKSLRTDQSSVVHLKDIKMELEYSTDYPSALEKQLFLCVDRGDADGALHAANRFFDWMAENYADQLQSIRTKALEFVLRAEYIFYQKGCTPYDFLCRRDYLDTLLACRSTEEIRRWFTAKTSRVCRSISSAKEEKGNTIVGKARQYIDRNFCQELSLEDVSRYVDVSPYYFSKLFKAETDQTFVEYVTALRIERAKNLLANPDASIKEICAGVGYSDPNYFSRIFKKVTGRTPTEYREGK